MTADFQGHGSPECMHYESLRSGPRCAECAEPCTPDRGCTRCRLYLLERGVQEAFGILTMSSELFIASHLKYPSGIPNRLTIVEAMLRALLPRETE